MTRAIQSIVGTALKGRRLVEHPFYRRWEEGRLTFDGLREYADQYRHFESRLPDTLAKLVARLPEGLTRDAVAANLADELGPPSHLALFEQFARHYGADGASPSDAMRGLLDAYDRCLEEGTTAAAAGVLAYEVQGAEIARAKAEGLLTHYGASADAATFWQVHSDREDAHASWLLESIEVDDRAAASAGATRVAEAWWTFLDEREAAAA